jgi:hypothetical protein
MSDKSVLPIRLPASPSEKARTGADGMGRMFQSRLTERQRAERERLDRYGRFGGR